MASALSFFTEVLDWPHFGLLCLLYAAFALRELRGITTAELLSLKKRERVREREREREKWRRQPLIKD